MDFKKLTEFIDTLPAYGIPSADITVFHDHKPLYRHSAGYTDTDAKIPVRGNELYFMYSCTKVVTCVAALQLFERGKFLMRDPVSNFLPEFANVKVRHGAYCEPAAVPMTMRQLFTMTAGMSYNLTSAYIQEVQEKTNGRCPTRETVAAMANMPLDFEPGENFQYSLCHDVLAAVVEVISGMKFGEYVRKNIFEPCGMTESGFALTDDVKSRMCPQYRFNDKRGVAEKTPLSNMYVLGTEYESGGAGLISSVNDYIKFVDALACGGVSAVGGRILAPMTVDMMRQNCLSGLPLETFKNRWAGLDGYGYGYGVRTFIDPSAGSLSSPADFGWQGAAGSYMIIDPKNRLSLFYAQHMLNNKEAYVHPRIRNCLYAGLY